ncbi:MAG TPA: choice-of-anchor D domain-containing protein, partial [Casimicrobiaceae bacterium]|nr:choice-of-anchor D domain-containing protein [Casimicrobiaceae bacterium]
MTMEYAPVIACSVAKAEQVKRAAPAVGDPTFRSKKTMRLQHVMAWVALVALASWGSSVALAQDASRGNTLYHSFPYQCDGCHGGLSPKNDPYANKPAQFPSGGVKTGASDWHYIQQGILYPVDGETDMTDALLGFYGDGLSGPITDQDLIDISAYLAGVFGGSGGGTPAISAPGSLSFTGAGSKSVSVSITGGTVAFNAPSISGANSGDFSISGNTCTGSKAPGSCQVSVTFTPGGSGTRSATLTISSNVGNALVSMSGPGTGGGGGGGAGQLQMPPNYDYGNQTVGTQSAPHAFTLTNTGGSSVSVSSVTSSDPANFPITSNGCTSVASGAACTINIAFAPQSAASP